MAKKLKLPARLLDLRTTVNPSQRVTNVVAFVGDRQLAVPAADVRRALDLRSTWFRVGVLSLVPPDRPAVYGSSHQLQGVARGVNVPTLEQRVAGSSWQRGARVRPAADGGFALVVKPKVTTDYRLVGSYVRGGVVRVAVAPALRLLTIAGRAGLRGTIAPAVAGARVEIQRLGARWETVATTTVDPQGGFEARLRLTPGTYRAVAAPGRGLVAGTSPVLRIVA